MTFGCFISTYACIPLDGPRHMTADMRLQSVGLFFASGIDCYFNNDNGFSVRFGVERRHRGPRLIFLLYVTLLAALRVDIGQLLVIFSVSGVHYF